MIFFYRFRKILALLTIVFVFTLSQYTDTPKIIIFFICLLLFSVFYITTKKEK